MVVTDYPGNELDLFQQALNWKRYWSHRIRPYLDKTVLEVGAGLGANVQLLVSPAQRQWHCLEPDPQLSERIKAKIRAGRLPEVCSAKAGTIDDLPAQSQFDTILYIDVMEHIEADATEFSKAASRLSSGGHLVILSPAYQALYSPFDAAIGHYRRYSRSTLKKLGDGTVLKRVTVFYLDSVGLAASLANKVLLRSTMPTIKHVEIWDRVMVRMSRAIDPLLLHTIGKTIVGVWKNP